MPRRILCFVLLSSLSISLSAFGQAVSEAEYQAKLKALQQNIDQLQRELSTVRGDRDQLLKDLEGNETDIGELLKKIDEIKSQLQGEEQALNRLHRERSQFAKEQQSQKKHVAQQVRAAYQLGGQSNIKLLLNQDKPETLSRMLKYHDYFLAAHGGKINSYIESIQRLDRLELEIVAKTRSLESTRAQLQSRHQQLSARQRERQQMLARLEQTIQNKDQALRQAEQDRRHIERLVEQIVSTVGRAGSFNQDAPFGQLRGKLPWPATGPIVHRYGSERIAGKMKWNGVVIGAAAGTPVKAIHHGRVIFADYLRGHGLVVIVDHGEGFMSLYAHNQSLSKSAGSWVEAGEVIAAVGSSGGQQEAGLYFEIRQDGQPANPSSWCG